MNSSTLGFNQMYGDDFQGYPPTRKDGAVSISAVVSTSCVIVNDHLHQQQHDDAMRHGQMFHLPENDTDGIFTEQGYPDSNQCPTYSYPEYADYSVAEYAHTDYPVAEYTHDHHVYPDHASSGCLVSGVTSMNDFGGTPDPTPFAAPACQEQTADSCFEMNTLPSDQREAFDQSHDYGFTTFNTHTEGVIPETPISISSNGSNVGFQEQMVPCLREESPVPGFQPVSCQEEIENDCPKNSLIDINVDEMVGSGVTVAGFKPRGIIRKRKKTRIPSDSRDGGYWSKRVKNNDSARRSREMKKEKERNFYKRALELEYENFYLKERISQLENQLSMLDAPVAGSIDNGSL